MKKITCIYLLVFFSLLTVETDAQGRLSIHAGPSVPISDFAWDNVNEADAGLAATGVNLGLEYSYPISGEGIGLFAGIDFLYNGLQGDAKDKTETVYEDLGLNINNIQYNSYVNIPFSGGLNYRHQVDDKIDFFAKGGVALNFLKITDFVVKANGQTINTEMDPALGIGFRIGGGISINKSMSISVDYYALGKHDLDGTISMNTNQESIDGRQKVDVVTLTVGVEL